MKKRIAKFELEKVIKAYEMALSGKNGERRLHNSGYGGSTLHAEGETVENTIPVKTMSLASFMEQNKISYVDILKVDIESSEKEVFGASDFPLVADKIKMIIGEHKEGLEELLKPLGFKYRDYGHIFTFER